MPEQTTPPVRTKCSRVVAYGLLRQKQGESQQESNKRWGTKNYSPALAKNKQRRLLCRGESVFVFQITTKTALQEKHIHEEALRRYLMDNKSDPLTASDSTPECLWCRHTTRTGVSFSPPNNYANLPYESSRIENKQYIITNNVFSRHEGIKQILRQLEIALLGPGRERWEFLFSPYLLCKLVAIFIVTGKRRAWIVKEKTRFLILLAVVRVCLC
jgi:hypothetical protein